MDSHLVDADTMRKLSIDDKGGKLQLPDLETLMPMICVDARRRIHAFLSYCKRTVGVPTASVPSCMPSVAVVVPVYGETVIRSWHQMMTPNADGLCNFEYMLSNRLEEFYCFVKNLPVEEKGVLDPLLTMDEVRRCTRISLPTRLHLHVPATLCTSRPALRTL